MIKNKEYPATHSMSTSWFAVDNEGNVGLLEFNENGPVPAIVPEACIEYIIKDILVDKSGKIKRSILTDEQVNSLVARLDFKSIDDEDFYLLNVVLRINPQTKDEFLDIMARNEEGIVILSEKEGLYLIDYTPDKTELKIISRLREKKCVLSYAHLWVDCVEEDESLKVKLSKSCENFPMFIYAQEYWNPALQRIQSPNCSVKASQLTEDNKERVLHLPFSFKDTEKFQIPFYCPSTWMSGEDISPSDGRYTTLEIKEDEWIFARTAELAILSDREDYRSRMLTFEPTIAIIKKDGSYILEEFPGYILRHAFKLHYMNRSEYLKELLKYYRPYLLIVMGGVLSSLENDFDIIDKKLILDDEEYPIFKAKEIDKYKDEIIALASKPYRGSKMPIILEKEE